jgi:hypothetical protein
VGTRHMGVLEKSLCIFTNVFYTMFYQRVHRKVLDWAIETLINHLYLNSNITFIQTKVLLTSKQEHYKVWIDPYLSIVITHVTKNSCLKVEAAIQVDRSQVSLEAGCLRSICIITPLWKCRNHSRNASLKINSSFKAGRSKLVESEAVTSRRACRATWSTVWLGSITR